LTISAAEESVALPRRTRAPAVGRPERRWTVLTSVTVAMIGLLITLAASGAAVVIDRRNERSLLQVQTRQAAAVIGATVLQISQPLTAAAEIAHVTGGNPSAFQESLGAYTGAQGLFVSALLLEVGRDA
jgi:hypothetical protein